MHIILGSGFITIEFSKKSSNIANFYEYCINFEIKSQKYFFLNKYKVLKLGGLGIEELKSLSDTLSLKRFSVYKGHF